MPYAFGLTSTLRIKGSKLLNKPRIKILFIHQVGSRGGAGTMLANILTAIDKKIVTTHHPPPHEWEPRFTLWTGGALENIYQLMPALISAAYFQPILFDISRAYIPKTPPGSHLRDVQ
jgi:hypothetical protein